MHDVTTAWLGLAVSTFGMVYALRRIPRIKAIWEKIPEDFKPFAPACFAGSLAALESLESGRSFFQAAALACTAAITAMLTHHSLKAAPGKYGTKPVVDREADTIPPR